MAKFIAKAIKRPGALSAKAKSSGKSTAQFAKEHASDSGTTGSEARFYQNVLRKVHPKSRHGSPTPKGAKEAPEAKVPAKSARPKSRRG